MRACCILIQKHARGWLHRNRYQRMRWAAIQIQRYIRGFLARRLARFLRRTKAAICIQRYLRGYYEWKKYQHIRHSIISLQSYARGMFARQHYVELLHDAKATIIQKCVRGWLARLKYQKSLKAIVLLQSCVRRMYARRELKKLKIEARSVEHVKKLNQGLENKIISLQQKMDQLTKENNQMKSYEAELIKLKNLIEARGGEAEMKRMSSRIDQLEKEILTLRANLLNEQTEKEEILNEKEKSIIELQKVLTVWNKDTAELKEKLCQANETIKNQEKELEEIIRSKSESEKMLHDEFESERVNYQKILKDYARLEQRFENLQSENQVMKKQTHQRTPSNLSTISIESTGTEPARNEEMDNEDLGYGSTRSMRALEDQHKKLENVDWSIASQVEKEEKGDQLKSEKPTVCVTREDVDIGLVLKLQQRIKELQDRNKRLEDKLENKDDLSPSEKHEMRPFEALRIQDLEMENAKLKDNFNKMRSTIETGNKDKQIQLIVDQHSALEEELERRRDECLQLRTLLANKSLDSHAISKEMYGGNDELINEDGELYQLYHAQRQIIRQLEKELQGNKVNYSNEIDDLRKEMGRLREDNERQQKLIGQHLQMSPEAKTEAIMQHEITRLTGENLDLQEKADEYKETIKQLKKRLKIYAKKLKDGGTGSDVGTELERRDSNENMPAVKHKEVNYLGMFEYKKESEPYLIKSLIIDLKPSIAVNLLPGLPAYILFMCIRHTDYINDDEKVRSLLTSTINGIKRVIKKKHEDFEIVVLWLTNICRLLHNLKQYSGDKTFQVDNTPKQNEQCLRNFDLSEYRQILSDIAVWIYQGIVKIMEETIQPFVVAAILEHEAIAGLSGKKPLGMRGRSMSTTQENTSPTSPAKSLDSLNKALDNFYDGFIKFGSDPEIISQIFRQIFYFICAGALNNLLLRKDLCHWSKGMQMRYNCSHMEQWLRDHKLQECGAVEQLSPIIQASQLLQARKTDEDVDSICDMCDKLTLSQIIKMLNLYTPADVFEERVPVSFIRKIQAKLQERGEANPQLLMDTKYAFPVRFPFDPSNVQLEDIDIPESLNIPFLKKI